MVIIEVAKLVAAKNLVCPKFPIKPVSTIPTNGIAKFEKKTGMDNKNNCFLDIAVEKFLIFIIFTLILIN